MVDYPDLSGFNDTAGIGAFISFPNASYPYFWAWIMGGLFVIFSLTLYFKEKERKGVGSLLSSLAVSSFIIIILSTVGTIIGFITLEIMLYILILGLLIIGAWFFFSNS